ncbi:nucleotide sugar dehydrogenase [Chloroflexota bacterium]
MGKICILGLGYIGLPTACLFATHGYQVVGVDKDEAKVETIKQGILPFDEAGLKEIFQNAIALNALTVKNKPENADVFLIAVPTPLNKRGKMAELSYVQEAARDIRDYLKKGNIVILESTVPVGVSDKILLPILEESGLKGGTDFYLAYCSERAMPGKTIYEMIHNHRIIGGINQKSTQMVKSLYSSFVEGEIHLVDIRTAEMVKLMENTCRDINIALANEFAQIAEDCGVNIWQAIELANKHPRVSILKPGPGIGGHCIPIDPWFLAKSSATSRIISLARKINDAMPRHILQMAKSMLNKEDRATITLFGVAYKGDVDDTRETPSFKLMRLIQRQGYEVKVYDPIVTRFKGKISNLVDAVRDTDCIVLVTDHSQFKDIDPQQIAKLVRDKNLIDTRNILDHQRWESAGFKVRVLGKG